MSMAAVHDLYRMACAGSSLPAPCWTSLLAALEELLSLLQKLCMRLHARQAPLEQVCIWLSHVIDLRDGCCVQTCLLFSRVVLPKQNWWCTLQAWVSNTQHTRSRSCSCHVVSACTCSHTSSCCRCWGTSMKVCWTSCWTAASAVLSATLPALKGA